MLRGINHSHRWRRVGGALESAGLTSPTITIWPKVRDHHPNSHPDSQTLLPPDHLYRHNLLIRTQAGVQLSDTLHVHRLGGGHWLWRAVGIPCHSLGRGCRIAFSSTLTFSARASKWVETALGRGGSVLGALLAHRSLPSADNLQSLRTNENCN
jgi:hypothetical protein